MKYMNDKEKIIEKEMLNAGKTKIENFDEIVQNFFANNYNIEGKFKFLYVEYMYYDENHKEYNIKQDKYISNPQYKKVKQLKPFLISKSMNLNEKEFILKIENLVKIDNLEEEIIKNNKDDMMLITDSQIKEILYEEGYENPYFEHYFYSTMDHPEYNLYASLVEKNVVKCKKIK